MDSLDLDTKDRTTDAVPIRGLLKLALRKPSYLLYPLAFGCALVPLAYFQCAYVVRAQPRLFTLILPACIGLLFGLLLARVRDLYHQNRRHMELLARHKQEIEFFNERLEQRVQQRTEQLHHKELQLQHSQKMEAIGRLAGGVAHDFNNLLMVIQANAQRIQPKVGTDAVLRDSVEEIVKGTEMASTLTRQLLAFSRRQVMQRRRMSLNESVLSIHKMLEMAVGDKVELQLQLDAELSHIRADPGQMQQILMNLCLNARDSMPNGGCLFVATRNVLQHQSVAPSPGCPDGLQAGRWTVLEVSDTGLGIEAETLKHIFEPFFTTKETNKGTGLGLSTVYGIVSQMGGSIGVESQPGGGTTFRISIPPATDTTHTPYIDAPPPEPISNQRGNVIVLDDNPAICSIVRRSLERYGYNVVTTGDAGQAVRLVQLRDAEVDLLIVDVEMPGSDGFSAARRIQQIAPHLRCLFMTACVDDKLAVSLGDSNVPLLRKPFGTEELLAEVRRALC